MHSCLSTNVILHRITSKLNLREKFGTQGVSRRWKNIAIECLRQHKHLVISDIYLIPSYSICDEHLSLTKNDNLIWGKKRP